MKIAAVVLAAGASSRLGQPKQNVRLGGESDDTLLDRTVKAARLAGLDPVIVVVSLAGLRPSDQATQTVVNEDPAEGMASSIRAGIAAAAKVDADGVMILACDQPAVRQQHLKMLTEDSLGCTRVVASAYAGRYGVPALFPASEFESLLALRGDTGARTLLRDARSITLPGGDLDIDTVRDLEIAYQLYSRSELK